MAIALQYNPTTGQITNWYDPAYFTPPSGSSTLEVTAAQYAAAQAQPGYTVQNGVLTPPTEAALLSLAQTQQITQLKSACDAEIQGGFPATINGVSTLVTLKQGGTSHDQTNAIMVAMMAQAAISQAKAWKPLTVTAPLSTITDNKGTYWVTFTGGTTGASLPSLPTDFSTFVTDGSVQWYKTGFRTGTSNGTVIVDPVTAVSLFGQGVVFVNDARARYEQLKIEVLAATTPSAVQSINWI